KMHGLLFADQIIDLLLVGIAIGIKLRGGRLLPATKMRRSILALLLWAYVSLWLGSVLNDLPLPLGFDVERMSAWKNFARIPVLLFLTFGAVENRRHIRYVILAMAAGMLIVDRGYFSSIRGRDFSSFSYALRDAGPLGVVGENGLAALLA